MSRTIRTLALATATTLVCVNGLLAQVNQPRPSVVPTSPPSQNAAMQPSSMSVPGTEPVADLHRWTNLLGSSRGSTGSVLVVPAAEISMDDLAAATEDMTVMARILQTALGQTGFKDPLDIYGQDLLLFRPGAQDVQSVFLQGYGALFTMKVAFPLAPGPQAEESPEEQPETQVDPVWQRAHQEVFDLQRPGSRRRPGDEQPKYSGEKVESLKTALITALKHAANIRNLTPDEAVVLTVTGRPVEGKIESIRTVPGTNHIIVSSGGTTTVFEGGLPESLQTMSAPTVLTIRAKRSDIDAFAQGDVTLDQFRQRVQVLSHPQLGAGAPGTKTTRTTGVNSR